MQLLRKGWANDRLRLGDSKACALPRGCSGTVQTGQSRSYRVCVLINKIPSRTSETEALVGQRSTCISQRDINIQPAEQALLKTPTASGGEKAEVGQV